MLISLDMDLLWQGTNTEMQTLQHFTLATMCDLSQQLWQLNGSAGGFARDFDIYGKDPALQSARLNPPLATRLLRLTLTALA